MNTYVATSTAPQEIRDAAAGIRGTTGFVADVRDQASVIGAVDVVWDAFDFMARPQGFWNVPAVIETDLTGYFLMAREITPKDAGRRAGTDREHLDEPFDDEP